MKKIFLLFAIVYSGALMNAQMKNQAILSDTSYTPYQSWIKINKVLK